tara:strand:- start:232 stop:840 length:609 start_codon:yes stop_codon:yes gene_type:complete
MEKEIENKPSLESLFLDFEHPNPNINNMAARKMNIFWREESINKLINNLNSDDLQLRRKSVKALSYFDNGLIKKLFEAYTSNNDFNFKLSCLKVLVIFSANNDVNPFIDEIKYFINDSLDNDSPEVILTLVSLLRQLGKPSIPILLSLIKDKNILRAKAAITALGEMKDSSSLKDLKELALDKSIDSFLRDSASEAIYNFDF